MSGFQETQWLFSSYVILCNCATNDLRRTEICSLQRRKGELIKTSSLCAVEYFQYFSFSLWYIFCITGVNIPAVAACWLSAETVSHSCSNFPAVSICPLSFSFCTAHTHTFCKHSPIPCFFSIQVCHTSFPSHFSPVSLFLLCHIHCVLLRVPQLNLACRPRNQSLTQFLMQCWKVLNWAEETTVKWAAAWTC